MAQHEISPILRLVEPPRPDLIDTFAANDDYADLTGESAVGIFIIACIVNAVAWLARNSLAIALGLFVGMMATAGLAYVWSLFL